MCPAELFDMKLLVLALLVVAVSAGPLGSCRWEKEHWCGSLKIAKECGAVKHCIENDWAVPPKDIKENDICQYCENIIADVRNFLTNNQTEAQIQNFLDQACSVIPVSELADQCKDYVDNDLPELFDMVRSKLDPQTICSAMGLCSGQKTWSAQAASDSFVSSTLIQGVPVGAPKANDDICKDCKTLVNDLKKMLTDKTTEDEIEAMLKQSVCASLGAMADECNSLVETYTPELLTLLSQEVDPDTVCAILCNQTKDGHLLLTKMRLEKSALYKAAQKLASAETCVICKTIMSELQNLDRDKTIQDDLKNFLKQKICSALGSLSDACEQTVDEYAPYLFELLVNELDPETRCRSLGLCTQSNSVESVVRLASVAHKNSAAGVKASAQCILCEFIMRELDQMLDTNTSEAAIVSALDKVCSVLPDTIKEECKTFVDTYAPAIIELLAQELDPQQICTALGLCKAQGKSTNSFNKPLVLTAQLPDKVSGDELCGVCQTIIQYIDSLLEENSTIQEIEAVLDKVCSFLPKDLQSQCDDFIAQYGPDIIKLITQFADPKEICIDLKLCTASKSVVENMIERAPSPPLLGAKECTWGPEYWCASRENAKKCNAVPHCEKHGWKN